MTTLEKNFHIDGLLTHLNDYEGKLSKLDYFEGFYLFDYSDEEMEEMKIELKQLLEVK